MKKYAPLIIVPLLAGCFAPITKNTITYQGLECSCNGNVKLILNGSKGYECICSDKPIIKKPIKKRFIAIKKQKIKLDECPTTITEIFNSKEFKKPLVVCKGKLLEPNQKTRIVRINK